MPVEPRQQHRWLERLLGDWSFETEAILAPGQPAEKSTGTERVHSLGGLWVVSEGSGQMPDGSEGTTLMTLGYDTARERFVGTYVGSMMTNVWLYDGALDAARDVLVLDSEGPSFITEGETGKYRDTITIEGTDRRTLTSHYLGADGAWHLFMTTRYRRTS